MHDTLQFGLGLLVGCLGLVPIWFGVMLARANRNEEVIARLDALLEHAGVVFPAPPSDEVMAVARRDGLIAGIRAYRAQTGAGLALAKRAVEAALRKGG